MEFKVKNRDRKFYRNRRNKNFIKSGLKVQNFRS